MKTITGFLFYFFFLNLSLQAQTNSLVAELDSLYKNFQYSTLIENADRILSDKERYSDSLLLNIYSLKAASHFAMSEQKKTRKVIIELLKINEEYKFNNLLYSPKLLNFYESVKKEFTDIMELGVGRETNKSDEKMVEFNNSKNFNLSNFNYGIAKSLILPGWGHLHVGNNSKGWILTSVSTVSLSSMVYFIFDTNKKEKEYLTETNSELINKRYDSFDKSYKVRNLLIASYAIIWLYSQIDLLFFSNSLGSDYIINEISQNFTSPSKYEIKLSFNIAL